MQPQQIEGQRAQTILVVDGDESTRRILDLSLRHAGFAVRVASNAEEGGKRLADHPDLVIVAADDPEGLDFCRRAKQADAMAPAVVLVLDPNVENKRRGLEAGADDFLARPLYVQEVVARSRALLQRRDRERLELSANDNERFISSIEDLPLVDLLRAIAANQKSGVAVVMGGEAARGELYFRQGRVVDAEVGRLSGRDAVYRLFCWASGSLAVEWKSIRRKDTIEMPTHDLLMEGLRRVDEWRRLLAGVPPLDTIFEVDYRLLAERLADIPDEVNRILRLFDGVRTFVQVIDDCGLPDLDAVAAIGKLYRERIIHDIRVPLGDDEAVGADMEGWLSDAAGPFRSPARHERDLFGTGPDPGVGVHGRRTAPIDPLGDGARDALADDMRVRFTDRLQAEAAPLGSEPKASEAEVRETTSAPPADTSSAEAPGAAPAQPLSAVGSEGIPELPLEALIDSAPTGNGARPSTLPGMGAAKEHASRAASAMAVAEGPPDAAATESATDAPASPLSASATPTAAAGAAPATPLQRASGPLGWSSDPGQPPRSASGEILVQKALPTRQSQIDIPRVHVREDSAKAYVRKSTATPPGSARALDEPPPLSVSVPGAGRKSEAGAKAEKVEKVEKVEKTEKAPKAELEAKPLVRKKISVDDGRSDAFSKSYAEDELGVSSRGRKVLTVAGIGLIVIVGAVVGIRKAPHPASDEDQPTKEQTAAPAAPRPTSPIVAPLPATPAVATSTPATVDPIGTAARKPATPMGAAREDLDERAADPRIARERVSEARPLLSLCRMAFEQNRMRDAEATCTAARDANPDSAEAHGLLAHTLFNRNKKRDALSAAEKAVKLNPKLADAYVIIGGVRQDAGETEEARHAYQRYLELEPKGSYAADLRAIMTRLPAKL
jgi:CheY-like chemotaxis protein/Tfp pilus assembly protein PilF